MQSPKSKRPHAPGENPASDNNPESHTGGPNNARYASSQAGSKAHVPALSPSGHHGSPAGPMYHPREVTPASKLSSGGPGYAGESAEANRKGGTSHQFSNGSD